MAQVVDERFPAVQACQQHRGVPFPVIGRGKDQGIVQLFNDVAKLRDTMSEIPVIAVVAGQQVYVAAAEAQRVGNGEKNKGNECRYADYVFDQFKGCRICRRSGGFKGI